MMFCALRLIVSFKGATGHKTDAIGNNITTATNCIVRHDYQTTKSKPHHLNNNNARSLNTVKTSRIYHCPHPHHPTSPSLYSAFRVDFGSDRYISSNTDLYAFNTFNSSLYCFKWRIHHSTRLMGRKHTECLINPGSTYSRTV